MVNKGVAPVDTTTQVGQLRTILGDTAYIDLVPAEPGFGDYTNFSDDQLQQFLTLGLNNTAYGAGYAFLQLAATFAAQAVNVKTADEQVDLTKRSSEMRQIATAWFERGDAAAGIEASTFFENVYPTYTHDPQSTAELETPTVDMDWVWYTW